MAKISARGCFALGAWRFDHPQVDDDGEPGSWRRDTVYYTKFTLRSDGVILRAVVGRHGTGRHAYTSGGTPTGWMRLKPEVVAKGRAEMVAAAGRTVLRRCPDAYPVDGSGRRVSAVTSEPAVGVVQ